jgi:hypothetical protein
MDKQFEDNCWRVLGRAKFALDNDLGAGGEGGHRHYIYFNDIEGAETLLSHLLERGFLKYKRDDMGFHTWGITPDGVKEHHRLFMPPDETAALKATIARLESELAAATGQLAGLS